jgi:hypothetical protein
MTRDDEHSTSGAACAIPAGSSDALTSIAGGSTGSAVRVAPQDGGADRAGRLLVLMQLGPAG